jgi:hypothetical protein
LALVRVALLSALVLGVLTLVVLVLVPGSVLVVVEEGKVWMEVLWVRKSQMGKGKTGLAASIVLGAGGGTGNIVAVVFFVFALQAAMIYGVEG